ncbi:DUF2059 domain-containing protein [Tamlana sp. s12]|uniref:DUF2059 domain-containing protein n=1 Tax=Tamlana sp. s12 TaxID=1630406 RepID=UPI000800B368|nr:DUF2059 domain-containing protein [Tamlana sp. s12]OBQ54951.1 hypothetical protein VQ01_09400 [Tamlana sp. s12]QQY83057.1 DUF2059 domain-containing protein [Tamlana sp. s12]
MKNFLLASLLLVVSFVNAQTNEEFKNEAIEFMKLTGATSAFDAAIDQLGTSVPADKKEAYTIEAQETLTGLYNQMADLYMSEFTHKEIKDLIAFYNSPLGKKLVSKQLSITQKAMNLGQNWAVEVRDVANKYQ